MKSFLVKIKKYKFIIGVCGIIGVFVFIFSLNTSNSRIAIKEIKKASSKEMVLKSWEQWIDQIDSKNAREKVIKEVKNKLSTMDLSEKEISEWHTRFKIYTDASPNLNIIIVPDLSLRIKQIPNTPQYDKEIISEIYKIFFDKARQYKSADRLILEVTDNRQASGLFSNLAEELSIDMTNKENNTNNLNYLKGKENSFTQNLDKLYNEALNNTSGADYFYYFRQILPRRIKKSDIYNEYENKIIILTDGYIETKNKTYTYTIGNLAPHLKQAVSQGNLSEFMAHNDLKIPSVGHQLTNTEILVLEITERENGIMWHKDVLQEYWKNWFIDMGVKNVTNNDFFQEHEDNINYTKEKLKSFLK